MAGAQAQAQAQVSASAEVPAAEVLALRPPEVAWAPAPEPEPAASGLSPPQWAQEQEPPPEGHSRWSPCPRAGRRPRRSGRRSRPRRRRRGPVSSRRCRLPCTSRGHRRSDQRHTLAGPPRRQGRSALAQLRQWGDDELQGSQGLSPAGRIVASFRWLSLLCGTVRARWVAREHVPADPKRPA